MLKKRSRSCLGSLWTQTMAEKMWFLLHLLLLLMVVEGFGGMITLHPNLGLNLA